MLAPCFMVQASLLTSSGLENLLSSISSSFRTLRLRTELLRMDSGDSSRHLSVVRIDTALLLSFEAYRRLFKLLLRTESMLEQPGPKSLLVYFFISYSSHCRS